MTAYERLCAARDQNRPTAMNTYAVCSVKAFFKLHGDRRYGMTKLCWQASPA